MAWKKTSSVRVNDKDLKVAAAEYTEEFPEQSPQHGNKINDVPHQRTGDAVFTAIGNRVKTIH